MIYLVLVVLAGLIVWGALTSRSAFARVLGLWLAAGIVWWMVLVRVAELRLQT